MTTPVTAHCQQGSEARCGGHGGHGRPPAGRWPRTRRGCREAWTSPEARGAQHFTAGSPGRAAHPPGTAPEPQAGPWRHQTPSLVPAAQLCAGLCRTEAADGEAASFRPRTTDHGSNHREVLSPGPGVWPRGFQARAGWSLLGLLPGGWTPSLPCPHLVFPFLQGHGCRGCRAPPSDLCHLNYLFEPPLGVGRPTEAAGASSLQRSSIPARVREGGRAAWDGAGAEGAERPGCFSPAPWLAGSRSEPSLGADPTPGWC